MNATNIRMKEVEYPVMVVTHDGVEYELDQGCDEDGSDNDDPNSWGFKLVETSYKGRTDHKLVAKIVKLSEAPDALYEEGTDEDGDYYWRVWFEAPKA